jgi:hypothetical protein
MKTLVIHPQDYSTDFLCKIYKDTDWTVINSTVSKKFLKDSIKSHDRIIMIMVILSMNLVRLRLLIQ